MAHKVYQKNRHRPEEGIFGDCHRACYASILEVDLEEIPHFFDQNRNWEDARPLFYELWKKFSIRELSFAFTGELKGILAMLQHMNPGVPYILGGQSRNGTNHSVVCLDGEIWHDPSIDQSGIVAPTKPDDIWVVTYIVGDI